MIDDFTKVTAKVRAEHLFHAQLQSRVSGLNGFPGRRSDDLPDPPYFVTVISEYEEIIPGDPVYRSVMNVVVTSHVSDSSSEAHDQNVRQIKAALAQIRAVGEVKSDSFKCRIYGLGPLSTGSATEGDTYGDVITFVAGFGEWKQS